MRGLAFLFAVAIGAGANAPEVKVIANESIRVSTLSAEELKRVFLIKTNSLSDGSLVVPVLGVGSDSHPLFLKEYLGKTDAALSTYYRSLVFTGKAFMPKYLSSDAEVIAYVARTKGAMGYVSALANTSGVRSVVIVK